MFDKLRNLFSKSVEKPEEKPAKTRTRTQKKTEEPLMTEKQLATQRGEPYVNIIQVDIDPNNINAGSFTLDWNDKFVINLIKTGYKQREDDTDEIIVDRWFQTVCRNIALEVYEQGQADPRNRTGGNANCVRCRAKISVTVDQKLVDEN